jgi:hypothetical protein
MSSPFSIKKIFQDLDESVIILIITVLSVVIFISFGIYFWYMINLQSKECSVMDELSNKKTTVKTVEPGDSLLKDYHIQTAYNCCSSGSYSNDFVGLCALKSVLKQGVRGLDFEIFSLDDLPIVSTSNSSNYYSKGTYNSIDFNEVMNFIVNSAFSGYSSNTNDPIIIHLRFKSNNATMYKNLAKILHNYESALIDKQYNYKNANFNLGKVPLKNLMGKIIIIVNNDNKTFEDSNEFCDYINMISGTGFMRLYSYSDIKNSDTNQAIELINYNKTNMTICVPDKGNNPANPDHKVFTDTGCNMIAMRYQHIDNSLEINNSFFSDAAFVKKEAKQIG